MRVIVYAFILAIVISCLTFGQSTVTAIQTGFVVITPVTGTGEGLSVAETFGEQSSGNLFQSSVLTSPLVTLTDVVVNVDPNAGTNTGIAIVNPNDAPATVTLSLRSSQGTTMATRIITLEGHQQISRFVTELFLGDPAFSTPITGLLFISSDVSVGVLGLAFVGPSFTSLPVSSQLGVNTATAQGSNVTVTPVISTFSGVSNTSTVSSTVVPVPSTMTQTPSTFPQLPGAPIIGLTTPLPTTTTQVTTPSQLTIVTTPTTTGLPQLASGVGGTGALLLPQIAAGGGWVSRITIANTSSAAQTIRVDVFDPFGNPLALSFGASSSNVVVAPGGVVTLSTIL